MERVFFICDDTNGECCSFPVEGFTDSDLEAIAKFAKVLKEQFSITVKIGKEDEFFE